MQIGHRREFLKVTFFKPFVRANRGIIVCVWSIYRDIELKQIDKQTNRQADR